MTLTAPWGAGQTGPVALGSAALCDRGGHVARVPILWARAAWIKASEPRAPDPRWAAGPQHSVACGKWRRLPKRVSAIKD